MTFTKLGVVKVSMLEVMFVELAFVSSDIPIGVVEVVEELEDVEDFVPGGVEVTIAADGVEVIGIGLAVEEFEVSSSYSQTHKLLQ